MKLKLYLEDTYKELVEKVSWPTWAELQNSAVIVMVATLIISVIIFIMDSAFEKIMDFIYELIYNI
jgi:preprotein translocase subunit SecE